MKSLNKNIYLVGILQDLGIPYSLLYVDKENRNLYLFVRESDNNELSFIAAGVSTDDVMSYMNESIGLINIFSRDTLFHATIGDEGISLSKLHAKKFVPDEKMKRMDMFDPELCEDDVWLETFMARIKNNQPLEIA